MRHILWYPGHDVLVADIVRAENCHLYDAQGRKYVDLESGVWCTSIGHGHPRVLRVLVEQSARIAHAGFSYASAIVEDAAVEILSLLGFGNGKCVFLCSGSDSVEYAVRVAQMLVDRPMMMMMADSYFGAYGSAHRRQGDEWYCFDWAACGACPDSTRCDERCEHWATIPFDRIGAFLLEPGSSSGFVRFPPEKLIRCIVHTIKEGNGLVLINEVTTGIGRTGRWFGHQHYGIAPDIVAMGKGIGNGYPVSVTALAPGVVKRLGGRPVLFAQSHQNDPLGAAIAHEVIRIVQEEGWIERGREIAAMIMAGLEGIKTRTGRIEEIRGRGLMIAIDVEDDSEASCTTHIHQELVRRGYVLARRPGVSVLRLDPALTIERTDIEGFLKALDDVLTDRSS